MPHTRSAKKNLRKAEKNRLRNRVAKRSLKTYIKRFEAATEGPADAAQKEFNLVSKKIDQTAAKGVIHKNKAARQKSQLAKKLNAVKAAAAQAPPAAPAAGS